MLVKAGFEISGMNVVNKTGYYHAIDDLIKGFVDGSLLAYYLHDKDPTIEKKLKIRISDSMHARFGSERLEIPMQALVVKARK